jgi:hypothetical protein
MSVQPKARAPYAVVVATAELVQSRCSRGPDQNLLRKGEGPHFSLFLSLLDLKRT